MNLTRCLFYKGYGDYINTVKKYFNEVHATLGGTRVSANVFTSINEILEIIMFKCRCLSTKKTGKQTNKSEVYKILAKSLGNFSVFTVFVNPLKKSHNLRQNTRLKVLQF